MSAVQLLAALYLVAMIIALSWFMILALNFAGLTSVPLSPIVPVGSAVTVIATKLVMRHLLKRAPNHG